MRVTNFHMSIALNEYIKEKPQLFNVAFIERLYFINYY